MTFSGAMIFMRQRHFRKLPLVSRKFPMKSMHQWTSTWLYRHADISRRWEISTACFTLQIQISIQCTLWEHGMINPIRSNLRKGLSHMIVDLSLFLNVHEHTLKVKLDRLVKLGVLKWINASEWAATNFIISKKDAMVRFISDFCELSKCIKHKSFPIPKIQDLLLKLEGFQHATSPDLNMGYYHIEFQPSVKD